MDAMKSLKHLMVGTLVSLALACGGVEPGPSPDAELCEHLQEGPATAVTAAASNGPAVSNDHRRYDVTLAASGGQYGGQVSFAVASQGEFMFALNKDVPVAFANAGGGTVAPELVEKSSTECTDIKAKYLVPLDVGTYTLTFGPTAETTVGMVIEETAHADNE